MAPVTSADGRALTAVDEFSYRQLYIKKLRIHAEMYGESAHVLGTSFGGAVAQAGSRGTKVPRGTVNSPRARRPRDLWRDGRYGRRVVMYGYTPYG